MSKQSMGDLFLQQRRERAASSAPSSNLTILSSASGATATNTAAGGTKPKSFAEIQREQQQHETKIKRPNEPRTNTQRNTRNNSSRTKRSTTQDSPIEQGVIHTLLDKFGFIHCADRPIELFFHYTSTQPHVHWDELNIGDEVEFRVGHSDRRGEEDKLKAFDVRVLPPDSIVWEVEDVEGKRYRGKVRQIPRENGRDKIRGVIKVEGEEMEATFTNADGNSRFGRNDVVEFSIFTERRTGMKLARDVTLIQSEKERLREEREAKMLECATLETGIVVRDKGDFGFIKCVGRKDDVHFNVSHIESDVERGRDSLEGQEVEFYVVDESQLDGSGGGRKKSKSWSARKIKFLPKGSVKFEHLLGEGVTGIVVECPIEKGTDGFGRSGGGGRKNVMGKIRLETPVKAGCSDDQITDVILQPDLYPGGTYAMNRVGSEMGSWIRPGDVLLFDVIQTISDGKINAVPTKHTQIASLRSEGFTPDDSTKPAIRLVELALMGRSEGVVRSIRDDYAFIHCAERNVDAYMKLYEIFPNELYSDLIQNNPDLSEDDSLAQERGRIRLEVGMEVSFDLSLQMINNNSGGRGGRGNMRSPPEKESLRARRVQILPKGSVNEKLPVATAVKATVIKEDKRQQFVGTVDLEEPITVQTSSQRYPYISKLLDYISAGRYGSEVAFNEIMSEKDLQPVISMVNGRDGLEYKYVPLDGESAEDSQHRKLCIIRRDVDEVKSESLPVVSDEEGTPNEMEEKTQSSEAKEAEVPAENVPVTDAPSKKKKSSGERIIKSLRYDRVAFPDLSVGTLGVGDIITCDLYLSRSSGQVHVENIAVIERKERPAPEAELDKKGLTGYVTEVVSSRQFGFITGVDESGSKTGDHVFFHFKTVDSPDDLPQDASPTKKYVNSDIIRKGDEVKYDAEPGKNGKLTATSITILPRGTLKLPNKVDKSTACTGYVLLEPSHTSLANTPSHMVVHSGPALDGAGRWDNVGKEPKTANVSGSNIKEEGVILLLADPSCLFSSKPSSERKSSIDESEAETKSEGETPTEAVETAVGTHVRYKASSLAYRFSADNPDRPDGPRRGDLVVFGKTKGAKLVKDIRIEKLEAATTVKGTLVDIKADEDTATFVSADDGTKYTISLSEVVSCEKSLLKENQEVNGVLHEGKIFGVCRSKDIYLISSLSKISSGSTNGPRQRPKLNLTVKKELQGMGGQIMAQSKMAKGPDGTNGFVQGWTKRLSPHVKTFVPANIPDAGFATHEDEVVADE